jgi:hypothetical protein
MRVIDADVLYQEVQQMLNEYNSQGMLNEFSVSGSEIRKILQMIDKQPELSPEHSERILSCDEIDCFNDYIESEKVDIAFGNTDWCNIYRKLVGDRESEYARERMDYYRERQ